MYLWISKNKKPKAYFSENYKDNRKISRRRIIKDCGYISDLIKAHGEKYLEVLKEELKNITKENKITLIIDKNKDISQATTTLNYGYFFLEAIYQKLQIDKFLDKVSNNYKFEYDLNEIMRLLVFSRILNPTSKLRTWENQKSYFEPFNTNYEDILRSLSVMNDIKEDLQLHIHKNISSIYGRDLTLMFYDVTNYYFEKDYDDEDYIDEETGEICEGFRKKGVCKSNTQNPLVVMGLLIDSNKVPVAYKLFRGNTSDCKTLIPVLSELKEKFKIGRIITTADKGLNSGNNLGFIKLNGDGYIVSQKIRGSKKEFIEEVLNQEGYVFNKKKTHKSKSIIRERTIEYTGYVGNKYYNKEKIKLKEKVVIFWSKDYDDRMKYKRKELMKKIEEYKNNPSSFKASNTYGIKRYFKTKQVDKKTGEEIKGKTQIIFDEEKYNRDIALDGYYAIITSEVNLTDEEIISKYRGLIDIEDSFRIIKSDLEGRPIYVRCEENIEGHFLTCFIALIISRLLLNHLNKDKKKDETKISVEKMKEALNSATCTLEDKGIYKMNKPTNDYINIGKKLTYINQSYATFEELIKFKKELNTTI